MKRRRMESMSEAMPSVIRDTASVLRACAQQHPPQRASRCAGHALLQVPVMPFESA